MNYFTSGSNCNSHGSLGCDDFGVCTCKDEYNGTDCNSCAFLYYPLYGIYPDINPHTGKGVICKSKYFINLIFR